jgi:uracil phosphoribosyltransferase
MSSPDNLHVARHPLVLHKLTRLRDRSNPPVTFRALVRDLTQLLIVEATHDLKLEPVAVRTLRPLAALHSRATTFTLSSGSTGAACCGAV